jgi:ribosomal protein L11 methylase PrmA
MESLEKFDDSQKIKKKSKIVIDFTKRKRERELKATPKHFKEVLSEEKENENKEFLSSNIHFSLDNLYDEILKSEHWEKVKKQDLKEEVTNQEFSFGNYDKYYYRRYLEALKDPRMGIFKEEWFKDKKCLDIGCNIGTLTIMIAVMYQPDIIDAVDIDYRLVKKAIKNMKYVVRNNINKAYIEMISKKPQKEPNIIEEIMHKEDYIEEDKQKCSFIEKLEV